MAKDQERPAPTDPRKPEAERAKAAATGGDAKGGGGTASADGTPTGDGGRRKVAMVTGGSRGIGRAAVEALLGAGYRVFFGSRSRESVDKALAELGGSFGAAAAGRPLDVRRQDEVDAFVEWVIAEAGRIDCLVNNAGTAPFRPVGGLSGDQWRAVLAGDPCETPL